MSTHNIGFYEDLTKIIFELSSNIIKYAPYIFCCCVHFLLECASQMSRVRRKPAFCEVESTIPVFPNPKYQASSHLLWLYSPVCVHPGWKSKRQFFFIAQLIYEPRREKTGFLHMRKQRRRSASWKLIRAFVFPTLTVHSLFYLNLKFQAPSHLLWLYSPVCVEPGRKPRRPVFSQRGSYGLSYSFYLYSYNLDLLVSILPPHSYNNTIDSRSIS